MNCISVGTRMAANMQWTASEGTCLKPTWLEAVSSSKRLPHLDLSFYESSSIRAHTVYLLEMLEQQTRWASFEPSNGHVRSRSVSSIGTA